MRDGPMGPSPSGESRLARCGSAATAFRSAPAQKLPPAPDSTATLALSSASKALNASASACAVGPSTALRTSARSIMMVQTALFVSI
jgi:hypothetical protein